MAKKLNPDQLKAIQEVTSEERQLRNQLSQHVLTEHLIVQKIADAQFRRRKFEDKIIEKYGPNATLNIETGAVTVPKPKK